MKYTFTKEDELNKTKITLEINSSLGLDGIIDSFEDFLKASFSFDGHLEIVDSRDDDRESEIESLKMNYDLLEQKFIHLQSENLALTNENALLRKR